MLRAALNHYTSASARGQVREGGEQGALRNRVQLTDATYVCAGARRDHKQSDKIPIYTPQIIIIARTSPARGA